MAARKLQKAHAHHELLQDLLGSRSQSLRNIIPGGSLTARRALDVYRTGYYVRLTEALESTFETVAAVMGATAFRRVARGFTDLHPSKTYNLNDYGKEFPRYLQKTQKKKPYLAEVADFELQVMRIFHLPSQEYTAPDFSSLDAEAQYFVFAPGAALIAFNHRIYDLWSKRRRITKGFWPANFPTHQWVLAYKNGDLLFFVKLARSQYEICRRLVAGKPVAEAITGLPGKFMATEKEVRTLFNALASPGIITGIKAVEARPPRK